MVVEPRDMRDGFSLILGSSGEPKGFGAMKGCRVSDFARFMRVDLNRIES